MLVGRSDMTRMLRSALRPAHWGLAARLPLRARRHYLHSLAVGRWGDFTTPVTFNEKTNWRILNDRRPIIGQMCDKDRMKDLALQRAPDVRVPRTWWRGTDLSTLPDLDALGPWVLKPNHSSGEVLFGPDPGVDLERATQGWLTSVPYEVLGEWGYGQARAELLLEERIGGDGRPDDYKFLVYDGVPRYIQVSSGRGTPGEARTLYTTDWRRLPLAWPTVGQRDEPRPPELEAMVDAAARLGAGMDFVRVDLYALDGEVWFGEFTPYMNGGVLRFNPPSFDRELGSWWTLPSLAEVGAREDDAASEADPASGASVAR